MAATTKRSTSLNIWVEINRQPARALIDSETNRVYIILAYTKR